MSPGERLMVHLHSRHVADLLRSGDGRVRLAYTDRYLDEGQRVPLSLSLPPSKPDDAQAARWIDGLLPSNPRVRDRWADLYGAARPTPFDLLSTRLGHDCAGAVQFCRPGETSQLLALESGNRRLTAAEFADLIDEVSADPVGWGSSGHPLEGFSLAGAYPKVALAREPDGGWSRPYGNIPSTHILKPSTDTYTRQAVNEFLALTAARHAGIAAAGAVLDFSGRCPALIVERFDRRRDGSETTRIHQEDSQQAAGGNRHIYQRRGGLSPQEIAALFRRHAATPTAELRALLAHLVFRWLIRDADGHSKNVTLQLTASDVRCSPLYDAWSLAAMNPAAEADMALAMWAVGTSSLAEAEQDGYWEHTSRALGLRPRVGRAVVEDIVARFPEAVRAAVSDLPDHHMVQETAERFLRLADGRRSVA